MLSNKEIIDAIQSAFLPYRCVAQIWDYETKVKFKVFDENNEGIIERANIKLSDIAEESFLQEILQNDKAIIEQRKLQKRA